MAQSMLTNRERSNRFAGILIFASRCRLDGVPLSATTAEARHRIVTPTACHVIRTTKRTANSGRTADFGEPTLCGLVVGKHPGLCNAQELLPTMLPSALGTMLYLPDIRRIGTASAHHQPPNGQICNTVPLITTFRSGWVWSRRCTHTAKNFAISRPTCSRQRCERGSWSHMRGWHGQY